jgi:uncharacterized membrane protein YhaH (DUF805 family)
MIQVLKQVSKQWIARVISLCIVGPICAGLSTSVLAADGSHNATFLTGGSMTSGLVALVLVCMLIMFMGIAIGRLVDRREGFLNIAFALGWVAWTTGRLGEVFRSAPESKTLVSLIILIAVLLTLVMMSKADAKNVAGRSDDVSRFDVAYLRSSFGQSHGVLAMGAAIVGSFIVAVLFGQNDLPGQSVGVGFGAGIVGGLLGALVWSSAGTSKDKKTLPGPTPMAPMIVGVLLCGFLAPMIGLFKPGAGELLALVAKGDLPGYLIVSPMAWAMGGLLGVPVGHSWVEHAAHQTGGVPAKA